MGLIEMGCSQPSMALWPVLLDTGWAQEQVSLANTIGFSFFFFKVLSVFKYIKKYKLIVYEKQQILTE